MRNKEIARSLGIEETTVKMHRANLQAKLGVKSTAELTRVFITVEILSRENVLMLSRRDVLFVLGALPAIDVRSGINC